MGMGLRRYFLAWAFLLPLMVSYQNCGDVGIISTQVPIESSSLSVPMGPAALLKSPSPIDPYFLAIFVVDMSKSMVTVPCHPPSAVDGKLFNTTACDESLGGLDPELQRFKVIDQWITETENFLRSRRLNPDERLQILIRGFSHNYPEELTVQRGSGLEPMTLATARWLNGAEARKVLKAMATLQVHSQAPDKRLPANLLKYEIYDQVPERFYTSHGLDKVKTSNPAPVLQKLTGSLVSKLEQLQSIPNRLPQTLLEVAFLSDGVAKPNATTTRAALDLVWKTKKVMYVPGGEQSGEVRAERVDLSGCLNQCTRFVDELIATGAKPSEGALVMSGFCNTCFRALEEYDFSVESPLRSNFIEDMKREWGDFSKNTPDAIFRHLRNLEDTLNRYQGLKFRLNFFRTEMTTSNIYRLSESEKNLQQNWMTRASQGFGSRYRAVTLNSHLQSVSLFPGVSAREAYRISKVFALNTRVRVNAEGIPSLDTDGDGLFDSEDPNPLNSRSQNPACLDSITVGLGRCVTTLCDPEVDVDGDGLNQCDEKSLNTSDADFDSDGDGIPDLFEVIYGLNPMRPDSVEDSNSDSIVNLQNFEFGLHPMARPRNLPPQHLTRTVLESAGTQAVTLPNGQVAQQPLYRLGVQNLMTTEISSVAGRPPFYKSRDKSENNKWSHQFSDYDQPTNRNRIFFVARTVNSFNPEDGYWVYLSVAVDHQVGQNLSIPVDFSSFQVLPIKDPGGLR